MKGVNLEEKAFICLDTLKEIIPFPNIKLLMILWTFCVFMLYKALLHGVYSIHEAIEKNKKRKNKE